MAGGKNVRVSLGSLYLAIEADSRLIAEGISGSNLGFFPASPVVDDFKINAGKLTSVAQVLRQEGKPYALLQKIDQDFSAIADSQGGDDERQCCLR